LKKEVAKKKVLSIQNSECETLGTLGQMFRKDGFEVEIINAPQDSVPVQVSDCSAIVILGGPMSVYDKLPYLQKEQALIRNAVRNNLPLLGVCLGSQLIAQALGGRVFKGTKKEIGWHDVQLSNEGKKGLFLGTEKTKMRVFQWHGDTYELPKTAATLAYTDLYPQAFKIGSAIGIQFHIEVDNALIEEWIRTYEAEVQMEKIDVKKSIVPAAGDISALEKECKIVYRNFTALLR